MEEIAVEFHGLPPFKANPGPGGKGARDRQALFRVAAEKALEQWRVAQSASHPHVFPWDPMVGKVSLSLVYTRVKGENDAANIIGGVSDALQGVAYADDKLVREITYRESQPEDGEDKLIVKITASGGTLRQGPRHEVVSASAHSPAPVNLGDQPAAVSSWETEIDAAWFIRAGGAGASFSGAQAASDAAKALGAPKLKESRFKTLQGLLDASPLLSSRWRREENTIIRI